jgi:hypothetical protein
MAVGELMTDVDDKLLEQQEQEQREKPQFDAGGNGHGSETPIADEELKQYQDEDEKLATTKLTEEDIDFVLKTIMKEAKYDELSIRQIFHGFNSTFTRTPIPHVVNSKNSGAGKSYLLNHVAAFYPEKYILALAGISDKAIFHSDGPMVIQDESTGEIKLLEPIINDLEIELESLQEKDPKGNKKKIRDIQSQIKSLQRSAQKLIDLNNKIIILQDTPAPTVFNLLMTLLSQDNPRDQLYAFTDKSSGSGKLIQSRNRIRGMPVIFTTQVIDDTDNQRFEEKNRRFIHVTPNTSREKIKEANRLTAFSYGYLKDEYDDLVVNRTDIEKAKQIIDIIIAKLKQHTKHLDTKDTGVKVPFALTILQSLPDDGGVWEMTVAERTMKYLAMVTKLHMDSRPRVLDKETGAFYPIALFEDLKETLVLMERGGSNVRPYLAEWYDLVFRPTYNDQNEIPKSTYNDVGIKMAETIVGVTTEELADQTAKVMNCAKPSIEDIRKKYLDPLINQGIINKDQSRINSKHNIYSPVNKDKIKHEKADKVEVSDPALFPTKDFLVQSFDRVFGYDEGEGIKNEKRLENEKGQEITLDQLIETYFANPEGYFIITEKKD